MCDCLNIHGLTEGIGSLAIIVLASYLAGNPFQTDPWRTIHVDHSFMWFAVGFDDHLYLCPFCELWCLDPASKSRVGVPSSCFCSVPLLILRRYVSPFQISSLLLGHFPLHHLSRRVFH